MMTILLQIKKFFAPSNPMCVIYETFVHKSISCAYAKSVRNRKAMKNTSYLSIRFNVIQKPVMKNNGGSAHDVKSKCDSEASIFVCNINICLFVLI